MSEEKGKQVQIVEKSKEEIQESPESAIKLIKSSKDALVKFRSQKELLDFANLMIEQGLVPNNITKPGHVISVIQLGSELGVGVMTALGNIHNIQGKPTLSVHLIAARLRERNFRYRITKFFEPVEVGTKDGKPVTSPTTELIFTEYFQINGKTEKLETTYSFSWRDATIMGLTTKDNWIRMPKIMLLNRCLVLGARFVCPESTMGLYETAELADSFNVSYEIDQEGNIKI